MSKLIFLVGPKVNAKVQVVMVTVTSIKIRLHATTSRQPLHFILQIKSMDMKYKKTFNITSPTNVEYTFENLNHTTQYEILYHAQDADGLSNQVGPVQSNTTTLGSIYFIFFHCSSNNYVGEAEYLILYTHLHIVW